MRIADVELVLGGARSGKSSYALELAKTHGDQVSWIATAEALDDDMHQRIARHRAERPAAWRTVEAPLALAEAIEQEAADGRCVVVDCLTLWLSNCLLLAASPSHPDAWFKFRDALFSVVPTVRGKLLLVSNEVGCGIVPDNALARRFRDEAGWLHQALAARIPRVTVVVAGIAVPVKRASA